MAKTKQPAVTEASPPADYTVLARRYRPQQFSELVGQEAVARALVNALKSNRVAHAYLFTGARGVGKTSAARILAKALNCAKGPTPTPCDQCDICQAVAVGEDIDVLEIDGASNRGIDEVREIRSNVQYRPQRAHFKIYIIDEVHMLTAPAFNALLKTLEEPPPHVKFIFATTEVQKIPVTILSRCQRFDFGGITSAKIVERLREVVQAEKLQADDEALELVARRAGGSMRDAQSLLDQLLSFGGDRLAAEQVHGLLGTAGDDRVLELAGAILSKEPARALQILGRAAEEGLQLGELIDQLIAYWRDLMVLSCAGGEAQNLSVPSRHRETLARQATAVPLDAILAGLDILAVAKDRLRRTNHPRVLLEMAVVRLGRLDDLVSIGQLTQMLARGPESAAASSPRGPTSPTSQVSLPESVKKKALNGADGAEELRQLPLTAPSLPAVWEEVLRQTPPMFAGELKKAGVPAISGPNTLALRFPARYNSARQYCQDPGRVSKIEGLLQKITGQSLQLRIDQAPTETAVADGVPVEADNPPPRSPRRSWAEPPAEPLVQRAVEQFGAQIIHRDDGFGTVPRRPRVEIESSEDEE